MLHKHLINFTRKYNKEFAIKGYSKLKKADLQTKIESVLNKQRKEIKEEYKQLKQMKAEPVKKEPVKKTPVKKPVVKKEPVKKTPVKKTPVKKPEPKKTIVKKPLVKKEPVKKPVVKKEPVKKPVVKKEPKKPVVKKSAPKKEYKFTNQDIIRLKDWADLHKRKYSTMDTIYKKEILFELKSGDISRQTGNNFDKYYELRDKLFDKMYPEESEEPKKPIVKKETKKPAPVKKEPVKKNDLDFSVLNFSAKKTYEDATKELIEYNKELKIIENKMKKGKLSKDTKETFESRIKFLNKNININNIQIKRIEDSIKRRMKRDVKINDFEKEGYKKVMKDHEKILEEVKKTNNINELDKLGNELNKNVGLMKKGYYKDDNIVKKFNKLNNDIIEILKKKSKDLMPKQKEKKEIKFTGKSIKITGDEIIKKVKEIKKTEPKKEPVKKEAKLDLTKEQQEVLLQASNHFYNDTPIYEKINELKIKYFDTLDKKYINEMLKLKNDYNTTKTKAKKIEKEIKQKELKERKKVEVDIKKFTENQKLDFIKKYDMYYEGSKDKILIDFLATDAKAKKSPPAQKQRKDLIEKRFNNLHPEIILTQADEKAVAKKKTNDKRTYEQLTKFYDTIGTLLGGRRVYNTTKKELSQFGFDADDIDKLLQAQKYGDFYPTPAHCIQDELLIDRIKKADYVFDPTAGLGNLIFHTLKYNKDLKVDVNEMNDNSSKLLNKLLGSYINNIYTQDYLKMKVDKSYDLYVLNPPFGFGGDKKFYYNFYFKMLYDINTTKKNSQITHGIFISPPLTEQNKEKEGEVIPYWDIMSNLSVKKIDDILNNQFKFGLNKKQIEKISKNDYEDDDEINEVLDYFSVLQVQKIKTCSGFAGTGMKAIVYLVIA